MSISQSIPIEQFPQWTEALIDAVLVGDDFTVPFKRIAVAARADFKERFATETAPDGSSWPKIRGFRQRLKGQPKALQDKGLLRASASTRGAAGNVEILTPTSLEVGTNLDYGAIHQTGGVIRPTNAKALTIPLTREAYRSGGARNMAGLVLVWPKGSRTGWLQEVRQRGRGKAKVIRHWLLLPEARIPKREFIGMSPKLETTIDEILQDWIEERLS